MFWIYVRQCVLLVTNIKCEKQCLLIAVLDKEMAHNKAAFDIYLPKCKTENRKFLFSLSYFL